MPRSHVSTQRSSCAPPEVVPHQPEVVLLEPHRVVQRLEPVAELLGPLGRCRAPTTKRSAAACASIDEPLVAELRREPDRLLDVGLGDRRVVDPVVGEPRRRQERLDHRPPVTDGGRERVRLLVGRPRDRRVLLLVERPDVVRAGRARAARRARPARSPRARTASSTMSRSSDAAGPLNRSRCRPARWRRIASWAGPGGASSSAAARSASASSMRGIARCARARTASSSARCARVARRRAARARRRRDAPRPRARPRRPRCAPRARGSGSCGRAGAAVPASWRWCAMSAARSSAAPPSSSSSASATRRCSRWRRGADEIGEQRLADLLVHEAVDDLAAAVLPLDEVGVLGFFERVEQRVLVEARRSRAAARSSRSGPTTAAVVSALRTSSPTRSRRRSITRRTVRGTSVSAISTPGTPAGRRRRTARRAP